LLLPLSVYRPIAPSVAPEILDFYVRPGLFLSDLAVGALLLTGLARSSRHVRYWGHRYLTVPLLALAGLALLTVPAAVSPTLAGYTALRWFLAVGVYLSMVQGDLPLERWVMVLMVGLGLQALVGLGQVLRQEPLGLPGELALEPARAGAAILTVGGRRWLRAYGLTFHPNVLGGFLAIGLVLGLPLLNRLRMQLLWWLLGLGLLVSFSRSAWLATVVVLPAVAGWLAWRRPALRRPLGVTLTIAALFVLLSGVLLAGQFASRLRRTLTTAESRSLRERGALIAIALDVITDRPLTGVGAGNFPLAMLATDTPALPQPVHNAPLLLAAEVGVVGAGLWFWLWLTPGLALKSLWHRHKPWLVVLIGAWFALGTISLWDSYPWALNSGRLLIVTVLGLTSRALTAD
jgi:O-antigen ligase